MKKHIMQRFLGGLAAIIIAVGLSGCFEDPPAKVVKGAETSKAEAQKPFVWPPISKDSVTIAKNLLAKNQLRLLDNSGSMDQSECSGNLSKFDVAKAALENLEQSTPDDVNTALAVFTSRGAEIVVPFGAGPQHKKLYIDTLRKQKANQGTPLYGALRDSYDAITAQARRQLGYGTYQIEIITDGYSMDADPGPLAKEIAMRTPIEIHTIGFCVGSNHSLNVPGYTKYYTANSPDDVVKGLAAVQAETAAFDVSSFSK